MLVSDQLKQLRASKAEAAQSLYAAADTEKRALAASEKTQFDALISEVEALNTRIAAQLTIEAATRDIPAVPRVIAPLVAATPASRQSSGYTLRNFRIRNAITPNAPFETRVEANEAAYRTGRWLQALLGVGDAKAWCQEHGVFSAGTTSVLHREVFDQGMPRIANVHEESANSLGGVLVPEEMERAIIDLREEYGAIRRFARIATMTSDTLIRPRRTSGLTAYFVGESGAFTESTKGWDNVTLVAKLCGVLAKYTWQLGEDAIINIADDLVKEAAYAFAVKEDNVGFTGTGIATDGGIVGIVQKFINNPTYAGVVNAAATHDNFSEIDADDIDNLVAKLPLYARRRASFYVGPSCKSLAFDQLLRAAGGNTQGDVSRGMPARYLGYNIEEAVGLPNNTAGNYDESPMILFGDMSAAMTLGNRRGITVQLLNELYAANGQIGVLASERFDINVHDIGDTTTVGPVVALHGETS